jgi:Trypsin-like peptidase domain/emp24/gp25L/p24 family/GOLD
MELSDEQKQRILEEEKQRLAEEEYRARVRRELQSQGGSAPAPAIAPTPTRSKVTRNVLVFVGAFVVIVGIIALIGLSQFKTGRKQSTADATTEVKAAAPSDKPSPVSPPPPLKLTTAQIAERATPSVVIVENFNEDGQRAGQGSGYVFSGDGIIITNYHVIRGAKTLNVRVSGQEPYHVGSVLGYEIEHDLAALQLTGAGLPALLTETVEEPKVGDRVVAIGAPLGLESTVSEGIVSALRNAGAIHIIQTTASISPGSSGGPLLNEFGKVIGLTTSTVRDGQSLNFVVSAKHITELLSRKQPMSLEEMLNQTQVSEPIGSSTIMVPARNAMQLSFTVNSQQGATLEGTYTVTGGTGRDVAVALIAATGGVVLNSGRVAGYGQFKQRLPRGRYTIVFDNRFSTFSSKSVSPDLKLTYYR